MGEFLSKTRVLSSIVVVLAAIGVGQAGEAPVPAGVQQKIAALSATPAYVPTWVPAGFIFVKWQQAAPPSNGTSNGSTVFGQGFTITFAHAGAVLLWSMQVGPYNDCSGRPYFNRKEVIQGRTIYYANGNHGDSAYFCAGRMEFTTWADHLFEPAVSMRIAASATVAH